MLVLTRKLDQTILIGDNVTITILKVRGNTVRVGIEAPREVPVLRGELETQPATVASNDSDSLTLEFKTNATSPNAKGGLRVVSEESEEKKPMPICLPGTNRLRQMVAKVSQFE